VAVRAYVAFGSWWLRAIQSISGRIPIPDEPSVPISAAIVQAEGYTYVAAKPELIETPESDEVETGAFTRLPKPINFGEVAVCPRCRGKTRRYNYPGLDDLRHKDPYVDKIPCKGCNGWGIVPNRGPIPMTAPEGLSS
jgi:hypothetical protein